MIIDFAVTNFRSFRDEQRLSLVATKDKMLRETHVWNTGVKAVPSLLLSAAIYGPNASGKSNLIRALQHMQSLVIHSAMLALNGPALGHQYFRLDAAAASQPTVFEISFFVDGIRHQYGFSTLHDRVTHEYLLVYKAFKPQQWFSRTYDAETERDRYEFGAGLKGQKHVWEQATRANALFLSTAVQLNSEQLRPIYEWFATKLVIHNAFRPLDLSATIEMLQSEAGKTTICRFLETADISIADIELVPRKLQERSITFDLMRGKTEVRDDEVEKPELRFHHVTDKGRTDFGLADESQGTRNLLLLAGPVLNLLKRGAVLVFDEIDNSMHTMLVRRIVGMFHSTQTNPHGAQLVFSTHDTSLLDAEELLRRDQVWFIDKDRDQASQLIALAEFGPRKNEALEKGYLMGRYGALPFFEEWKPEPN